MLAVCTTTSNAVVNSFGVMLRGPSVATTAPLASLACSVPMIATTSVPAKNFTRACGLVNVMTSGGEWNSLIGLSERSTRVPECATVLPLNRAALLR